MVCIGVVGDFNPLNETHLATESAVEDAAAAQNAAITVQWLATEKLDAGGGRAIDGVDGLIIGPGSPYRSLHGALGAIEYARVRDLPLLGTCAGFQHIVIEFARHVVGFEDAQHAEYDPLASRLFITPLSCSLARIHRCLGFDGLAYPRKRCPDLGG